jgi:hypothetical protein
LHGLQESGQERRSSTSLRAFPPAPRPTPSPVAPQRAEAPATPLRSDASVAFGWDRPAGPQAPAQPIAITAFSEGARTDSHHATLAPDETEEAHASDPERDGALRVAAIAEASLPPVTVALTALAMLVCLIGAWLLWVAYQNDGLLDLRRLDRAMVVVEQVAQPPSLRSKAEIVAPTGALAALAALEVTEVKQSLYPTAAGTELVVVEGFVLNRSKETTFRRIYVRVTATSLRDEVFIDRLIPAGALLEQPGLEAIKDGASLAKTYDRLERRAAGLQIAPGQRTPFSAVAIVPKGGNLTDATIKASILDAEQLVPEACWRSAAVPEGSGPEGSGL